MPNDGATRPSLWELVQLFLKLGALSFGGPAGHIALMEEEVVRRRGWLSREYFLDLVGATNLIPGPNATEMAIHIGYLCRGWSGLLVAGACFILPGAIASVALAWAYVRYGSLPELGPLLAGAKAAVLAVILVAVLRLGRISLKGWPLLVVGIAVLTASAAGVDEILALFGGALLGMVWVGHRGPGVFPGPAPWRGGGSSQQEAAGVGQSSSSSTSQPPVGGSPAACVALPPLLLCSEALAAGTATVPLWALGLFFLKVGAVLYGSGYVLIAFLEGGIVREHGWLSQQQLLDAIAAGQVTPGPLLSTAAFVGYLLRGGAGAAVATVAVFLPSFVFVVLLSPVVPRLRKSRWSAAFLDSVNVASVSLMLAVGVKLGCETLTEWRLWAIAALAAAVGIRWRVNTAWLILGGAAAGWLLS